MAATTRTPFRESAAVNGPLCGFRTDILGKKESANYVAITTVRSSEMRFEMRPSTSVMNLTLEFLNGTTPATHTVSNCTAFRQTFPGLGKGLHNG
ncbi:hypothetical protein CDAR_47541 [Caerostris darwini]|uniref:Uncharacterized protein n=1 Tax=Caerostris darwini TaxID=1538125 RepID=A0AAV4M9S0_9ARAC|nr:hypothetical protein CDAR_47541 [Caerostris darwini]